MIYTVNLPPHGQSKAPKIGSRRELLPSGLTQSAITLPHNNCCRVPQNIPVPKNSDFSEI